MSIETVAVFHVNSILYAINTSEVSVGWGSSLRRTRALKETLVRFENGHIEPKRVGAQVNDIFPEIADFPQDWEDACIVYPGVRALFQQINALKQLNVPVYFLGPIDPLHEEAIKKECGPLPGIKFLSWDNLLADIRVRHPLVRTDNIFIYYNRLQTGPWYDRLGFGAVRSLSDPIQKLLDDMRKRQIKKIESSSKLGRFQAISLDPFKEKPSLVPQLRERTKSCSETPKAGVDTKYRGWTPGYRNHLASTESAVPVSEPLASLPSVAVRQTRCAFESEHCPWEEDRKLGIRVK